MTRRRKRRRRRARRPYSYKLPAGRVVMRMSLRAYAVGLSIGGHYGLCVRCSVCGRTGLKLAPTHRNDGEHERVAHVLVFTMTPKNESVVTYIDRCIDDRSSGFAVEP